MKKKLLTLIKFHYPIILFTTFYFILIATKLINKPLPFYDWDESLYAETGREMMEKKFFLFPLWQGQVWLDKPPFVPLIYGIVMKFFFFTTPEISTRLFTLLISITVSYFTYALYYKVFKEKFFSTFVAALTAFTPIYIQRSQVLNQDIFLLLGWLGYPLFFSNPYLSLLFLAIAVFSKSLVGFFPAGIMVLYFFYLFVTKKINQKELLKNSKKIFIQVGILLLWFVLMLLLYKYDFWHQHIIESHFRRVTASIESHFGKRTYYFDLVVEQFGLKTSITMIIGFLYLMYQYFKKKISNDNLLKSLFLFPWFAFLNLTKTKIFWYLVPAVPQLAFLAAVPLQIFRKHKFIYYPLVIGLILFLIFNQLTQKKTYAINYSDFSPHYSMATYAKNNCDALTILMDKQTRETYSTLASLNLVITTTHWWGNHPSIVYYFEKPVNFVYDIEKMQEYISSPQKGECIAVDKEDIDFIKNADLKQEKNFDYYYLFSKPNR